VFFVGKLIPSKGAPDAIDAVARLRQRGVPVTLTIAGGGGDEEAFKQQALDLGMAQHIEFIGRIPNETVVDHMRAHDAVLVPSRTTYPEGMPNVVDEALASGSPLIASAHPSFVHRLVDGENSALFEPGDAESLSARIESLMNDTALYEALSKGGIDLLVNERPLPSWMEIQDRWLSDSAEDRDWLRTNSMAYGNWL